MSVGLQRVCSSDVRLQFAFCFLSPPELFQIKLWAKSKGLFLSTPFPNLCLRHYRCWSSETKSCLIIIVFYCLELDDIPQTWKNDFPANFHFLNYGRRTSEKTWSFSVFTFLVFNPVHDVFSMTRISKTHKGHQRSYTKIIKRAFIIAVVSFYQLFLPVCEIIHKIGWKLWCRTNITSSPGYHLKNKPKLVKLARRP